MSTASTTAASEGQLRRAVAALRHRDFALMWSSAVASNTGNMMRAVTVPFVIYKMTDSTVWLGITTAATMLPPVLVGPLAGVLADTRSRRHVLLATQTVQMLAAFALWGLWVAGLARPTVMLAVVVVGSVAGGINITSWQSFIPTLVPREDLLGALRLNSIQFTLSSALGPALAGAALSRLGPGFTFFANGLSFLLVIGALLRVRGAERPAPVVERPPLRDQVADGVRYIRRRRRLVHCIVTTFVLGALANGVIQLAPAIATDKLAVGDAGYGMLLAFQGTGAVIMALVLAVHADRFLRSKVAFAGLLLATLALCTTAAATRYAVALSAFLALGLAYIMIVVSLNTAMQYQIDDTYRGRVLSLYLMGVQLGPPIGTIVLGALAERTSLSTAIGVAAAGLALYAVSTVVFFDRLRGLDIADGRPDSRWEAPEAPAAAVVTPRS